MRGGIHASPTARDEQRGIRTRRGRGIRRPGRAQAGGGAGVAREQRSRAPNAVLGCGQGQEGLPLRTGEAKGRSAVVLAVAYGTAAVGGRGYFDAVVVLARVRGLPVRAYNIRGHDASSLLLRSTRRMSRALASGDRAS